MKNIAFLIAAFCAQPAFAFENCLVGTWDVNVDDVATLFGDQLHAAATHTGGAAHMVISSNGEVNVFVGAIDIEAENPGVPVLAITINGTIEAALTAENNAWNWVSKDYALTATALVEGNEMERPFEADDGMFGGGSGTYVCGAETVVFESEGANPQIPRRWTRAPG